jgi:hypothetical protein
MRLLALVFLITMSVPNSLSQDNGAPAVGTQPHEENVPTAAPATAGVVKRDGQEEKKDKVDETTDKKQENSAKQDDPTDNDPAVAEIKKWKKKK